ncbi:VWFA and cache domain-containing protein 1-like [Halichondria panicea]|uniref:VWFA and cache domain-containing protein 1-like n=1 Tax=Halichondria panicea TaxID=6063 RepID=UPI00312B861E
MAARCVFVVFSLLVISVTAQLSSVNIGQVVQDLAQRFQDIRNDGLGIDQLEGAYRGAQFNYNTLSQSQIEEMLTDSTLTGPVNSVLSLFDDIVMETGTATPLSPQECCSSTDSNACCHQCDGLSNTELADRVAALFTQHSVINGGQLYFGLNEGPLIQYPRPSSTDNCVVKDARLQQWHRRALSRPLEVVIVLDASNASSFVSNTDIVNLKEVATSIIRSLTQQDMVAVVRPDRLTDLPLIITRLANSVNPRVVPVCDDIIVEMEQFATSVSEMSNANMTTAFQTGIGLFSSNSDTDKVLVSIVPGITNGFSEAVSSLEETVSSMPHLMEVVVSSYRAVNEGSFTASRFTELSEIGRGGGVNVILNDNTPLVLQPLAGRFYPLPSDPPQSSSPITGRATSSISQEGVLTISRPVINGTQLIGVLHAELPWQHLFSVALTRLAERKSSYPFAFDYNNQLLFHPLLPSNVLGDVPVTESESETMGKVDVSVLNGTSVGTILSAAVTKTLLVQSTAAETDFAFVVRQVPARYHCTDSGAMYVCVIVADEDVTVATLQTSANVQGTYSSRPSGPPLYHNLPLSAPTSPRCDYFCKASLTDRLSFQLTSPSQPPTADDQNLVQEVSAYIQGTGSRPSWVTAGVATEIALGSVVASQWVDRSNTPSDYISRRHLATPSGAYLTYPPTQFVPEYRPRNSNWYTASQAHPSLLTLTPPTEGLREGSRLSVSVGYAVRTPSSESDNAFNGSSTLAVVAAELTLDSLRGFVRQALPLCEGSSQVSCFIIDDLGSIIYDEVVVHSGMYRGGALFLERPFQNNRLDAIRVLFTSLQGNLVTKRECEDYFVVGVETRRFYSLDITKDDEVRGTGGGCINYVIQRIPGTNAFMVVMEETRQCGILCFCSRDGLVCQDCETFSPGGCECPCYCREECLARSIQLACPAPKSLEPVNYEVAVAAVSNPTQTNTCFNQNCNCKATQNSCLGVRECSWCASQQKCVYYAECCDSSSELGSCCDTSPQLNRFTALQPTCNLQPVCTAGHGLTSSCPQSSGSNTAVVAGVVGGLFAVVLLALIVALVVWYQVCRRDDPKDETSRESAFDFSSKRTEATNPTSSDVQSQDGLNKSPVSKAPSVVIGGSTEKTDSTTL